MTMVGFVLFIALRERRQSAAGARRLSHARDRRASRRWARVARRSSVRCSSRASCWRASPGSSRWASRRLPSTCSQMPWDNSRTARAGPCRTGFDSIVDWRVFTFLALVCLGTGILFGLVPALQASRTSITGQLVQAGTGHTGTIRQRRWTTGLVVAQLALTPMLLAGAGLDGAQHRRAAGHGCRRPHRRSRANAVGAVGPAIRLGRGAGTLLSAVGGSAGGRARPPCHAREPGAIRARGGAAAVDRWQDRRRRSQSGSCVS